MPSWLLPALKAVLPHVGTIVDAAKPVFTRKKTEAADVQLQQIAELQAAASQNAENLKELAQQLQNTVAALEQSATAAVRVSLRGAAVPVGHVTAGLRAVAVVGGVVSGGRLVGSCVRRVADRPLCSPVAPPGCEHHGRVFVVE